MTFRLDFYFPHLVHMVLFLFLLMVEIKDPIFYSLHTLLIWFITVYLLFSLCCHSPRFDESLLQLFIPNPFPYIYICIYIYDIYTYNI